MLIGNNIDSHAYVTTKSSYEHISNFKCTNHDDNDDDENVDFMFENVIKAHNMLIDVNDVLQFVPKANQGPLQSVPTATGLCLCIGKCRFKSINGSHAGDYDFIPLQPLGRFRNHPNPSQANDNNYITLHNRLINRETPNCAGPQLQIQTDLNIPFWEELLKEDMDHQLIYFLKYGFPLDMPYSPAFEPNTIVSNHSTAKQFPTSIQVYLKTEVLAI